MARGLLHADLIDVDDASLGSLHVVVACLKQLEQHRLHVFPHIPRLCQRCRIRCHERHVDQACQRLGQQCLAGPCNMLH